MTYNCPFCGMGKKNIKDIKNHIDDMGSKCYYWSDWIKEHKWRNVP